MALGFFRVIVLWCRDEFCEDGVAVLDEAAAQRVERREDRRVFEAQAEAQELVRVAAEDWHAVENVGVLVRVGQSVVNGEGGAVAGFLRHALELFVVRAARVGDEVDGLAEAPLERLLGAVELMPYLVSRNLVEFRMGERVALEIDEAALLHLIDLRPGHVIGVGADEVRDQEDRALEVILLEDRVGVLVVVDVAVVEGQDDGLLGQWRAVLPGIHHLFRRNRVVAVVGEVFHLLVELVGVDRQGILVAVVDLVVVEHRHGTGGRMHAVGTESKHRQEDYQQEQQDSFDPGSHRDTSFSFIQYALAMGTRPSIYISFSI